MSQITAVTNAITHLNEAHRKFHLSPTSDPDFFPEWHTDLPSLNECEIATLERLKNRYLSYAADGAISEETVHYMMISPLLELLNLYDPPYKVRSENYVSVVIDVEDTILEGRIDALVIQDQLWVILIEARKYGFSVLQALPQTLAYMMAHPSPDKPLFAMITTGEDYLFIKLHHRLYAQSHTFTLLSDATHNVYRVLQIMKRMIAIIP